MAHVRNSRRAFPGLAVALALAACGGDAGEAGAGEPNATADTAATRGADGGVVVVENASLQTPESVLHDADADVYLVSNINGAPLGRDDNGFISRVRPDGTIETLKWIDGAAADVTLNAPKGMAIKGDTLFVSDIDSVRAFHRSTGRPLGARGVPNAAFLNDLAVADGTLYVSDTGVDASFSPTGAAAIYGFGANGRAEPVARGEALGSPNGIVGRDGALIVVPFGSTEIRRIPIGDQTGGGDPGEVFATLPGGQLDGVVALDDGSLLVSSWETSTVYHVTPSGEAHPIVQDVQSPADIGWDAQRRRVLVPLFMGNRLEFHPVR